MENNEQTNYPFDAVIVDNTTGHCFRKEQVVSIIDFFNRYRGTDYYHAVSTRGKKYLVSNNDFTVNTQNK